MVIRQPASRPRLEYRPVFKCGKEIEASIRLARLLAEVSGVQVLIGSLYGFKTEHPVRN